MVGVIAQLPLPSTVAVPITVVPLYSVTVSPVTPVPRNTGETSSVTEPLPRGPVTAPTLSSADSIVGAAGAVVSTVMAIETDGGLMFPAGSVTRTVML